jgi:F-box domain
MNCSESSGADDALVLKGRIPAGGVRCHALRRRCCEDMASIRQECPWLAWQPKGTVAFEVECAARFFSPQTNASMTEMDAPSTSSAPSFITNLPNEVLGNIISYIPMQDLIKWIENGKDKRLRQIMVLMHVCRAFRTAVFESDAFLTWDFDFSQLPIVWVSAWFPTEHEPESSFQITQFVRTLFADDRLVRSLARKRHWLFCEPFEVLLTVIAKIPTFRISAQKVRVNLPYFTDRALSRLSVCQGITELVIDQSYSGLNLDQISQLFPRLQHLKVSIPPDVSGSLNSLKNLISLEVILPRKRTAFDPIDLPRVYADDFDLPVARVLPFDSAETFNLLRFEGLEADCLDFLTFDLTPFRNLRHFYYRDSLDDYIVECLQKLDIYLETFEFFIDEMLDELESTIFSFRSLSRPRSLIIDAEFDWSRTHDACIHTHMDIVVAISENLQHINHIVFAGMGMDLRRVQCLSRLRNLKSIHWELPRYKAVLGEGLPEEVVAKAFESFEVEPEIQITRRDHTSIHGRRTR